MKLPRCLRQSSFGILAAATIVATATHVRPVFLGRQPVVERLTTMSWRDSAAVRAPWLRMDADLAMQMPRFDRDRRAFALDLLRTGKVSPERAEALAAVAVREAYRRNVPPALVFGVLMTENTELRSTARSNVGAVGLMQIHATTWVRPLGRYFGTNLRDDETNLRYGIYILRQLIANTKQASGIDSSWRTALLRYNGCVRGTNTPNCHTYPDVVRAKVEDGARALCGSADFETCVARPLWLSRRHDEPDQSLRLVASTGR